MVSSRVWAPSRSTSNRHPNLDPLSSVKSINRLIINRIINFRACESIHAWLGYGRERPSLRAGRERGLAS